MELLVLGANGLLGSNTVAVGQSRSDTVVGTFHSTTPDFDVPLEQFDLRDTEGFESILETHDPNVVVNCAAMTDVDGCEENPELAHEVNARAPGALAEACRERDIRFVHVSTDYVFDGTADEPYPETAPTAPIQEYGESKLAGEHRAREADSDALIVRLSFVWGIHRGTDALTGFPAWIRDRLTAGERTPLFTDQQVTPSRARSAAAAMLELAAAQQSGLFHVAARSCVTPYQFGLRLCRELDASPTLLEEGSREDLDRPAARPRYTCLNVSKVERTLDRPQPTLDADLSAVADLL